VLKIVTYNNQNFKAIQSESLISFDQGSPIVLMPEITSKEFKEAKLNSLQESYNEWLKTCKKRIAFKTWLLIPYAKQLQSEIKKIYDAYDRFKSPFYTPEFRELVKDANSLGLGDDKILSFVNTLYHLRYVSYKTCEELFFVMYENVSRLFQFRTFTLTSNFFSEIVITEPWQQEQMEKTFVLNRETGKGEFGSLCFFSNDFRWPSKLEGDVDYLVDSNWIPVEWKSCKTRIRNMRLGATDSWADSQTYKKIMLDAALRNSSIKKEVNPKTIAENAPDVTRVFGSIELFIHSIRLDIQNVIRKRMMFVYVSDEHTIININPDSVEPYGVTSEGRFLFTIVPNNRLNMK